MEITGAFALMRAFSICQHLSSSDFVTYLLTYVLKLLDLCTNTEHQGKNTGEISGAIKLANPARVTVTIDSEDLIKDSSQQSVGGHSYRYDRGLFQQFEMSNEQFHSPLFLNYLQRKHKII